MSSSADEAKALHSGLPPAEKRGPASVRRRIGRKVHGKEKKILVAQQPKRRYRKYWLHNELQRSMAEGASSPRRSLLGQGFAIPWRGDAPRASGRGIGGFCNSLR